MWLSQIEILSWVATEKSPLGQDWIRDRVLLRPVKTALKKEVNKDLNKVQERLS